MRLAKVPSAYDYRLKSNFEVVRRQLLQDQFANQLEQPLGYWALPKDRRLPLAFLGRTVGELVNTPFHELVATPGVGQKKMQSLLQLLRRAMDQQRQGTEPRQAAGATACTLPPELAPCQDESTTEAVMPRPNGHFDPTLVSELVWSEWQETVRRHQLGHEKLGRLATSLQALPSVIWHLPLSTYLGRTLSDIRQWKTYGEKRVRVVLEVFYSLHRMLPKTAERASGAGGAGQVGLSFAILPAFVPPIMSWVVETVRSAEPPTAEETTRGLIEPLLQQIEIDAGPTVRRLAAIRLGLDKGPLKVRSLARELGVTRARIYQLLDECHKVMDVRWPEGRDALDRLQQHLMRVGADPTVQDLVGTARDLCWPQKT